MAKANDTPRVTNEEIEAKIEDLTHKLERLRICYEQYFIGTEKRPPVQLRMDVARLMRELERLNIRNTALKFKVSTCVQKFTSYSNYWNRVLREIEDGTYKRHLDRAKRNQSPDIATQSTQNSLASDQTETAASAQKTRDVADEAEAFLASLGLGSPSKPAQPASAPQSQPSPAIVRPAFVKSQQPTITQTAQQNTAVRQPTITQPAQKITQQNTAVRQPTITQPAQKITQQNTA
ncbi:MAG: hypothetical protein IKY83_05545, partial [Proteobacteria bacterium]|nr:hypothetical protein [Pseudomonadota bacterium]